MLTLNCAVCKCRNYCDECLAGTVLDCTECGERFRVPTPPQAPQRPAVLPLSRPKATLRVTNTKSVITPRRFAFVMAIICAALMFFTTLCVFRFATMPHEQWQSICDGFASDQALREEQAAGIRVLINAEKNGYTGQGFSDYNNRLIKRLKEIEWELHRRDIVRFVK